MSLVVVDASVLVAFYLATDQRQALTAQRLSVGDALFAPAHFDAEIVSALRGVARSSPDVAANIPAALRHLSIVPIRREPLAPLLERMWNLRENMRSYDAAYIALAEQLGATVVTCDGKLAAAPNVRCAIDVIV